MSNKIFVCDDDEGILELTKIVLEDKGYQVIAAISSKSIVQQIQRLQPDLIILDLWMPEMSGEEITKQLKANEATAAIPVIISSASNETEAIAQQIGADACLCKPFDIDQLENMVESFFNK